MIVEPENCNEVCGFMYCVEGTEVIRHGPGISRSTVISQIEIEDSLTSYQLALLQQNKQNQKPALRIV